MWGIRISFGAGKRAQISGAEPIFMEYFGDWFAISEVFFVGAKEWLQALGDEFFLSITFEVFKFQKLLAQFLTKNHSETPVNHCVVLSGKGGCLWTLFSIVLGEKFLS